jgi:hypothetical protein
MPLPPVARGSVQRLRVSLIAQRPARMPAAAPSRCPPRRERRPTAGCARLLATAPPVHLAHPAGLTEPQGIEQCRYAIPRSGRRGGRTSPRRPQTRRNTINLRGLEAHRGRRCLAAEVWPRTRTAGPPPRKKSKTEAIPQLAGRTRPREFLQPMLSLQRRNRLTAHAMMAIKGFIVHDRESGAYALTDSGRAALLAILGDAGLT